MGSTTKRLRGLTLNLILLAAACGGASQAGPPSPQGAAGAARPAGAAARPGPKPYREVVTAKAVSDSGLFTVHRVDDKLLFEVPDSLLGADMLLVSRFAGVPANMGGFVSAGLSVNEQMVRWERQGDQVLLRKHATQAVADDSLPIHVSVVSNNFAPILAAFPIQPSPRTARRWSWTSPSSTRVTPPPSPGSRRRSGARTRSGAWTRRGASSTGRGASRST